MPELYHPDLDVTIVVDERRAENRRDAGWVDLGRGGTFADSGPLHVGESGPETFPVPDPDDTVEDED